MTENDLLEYYRKNPPVRRAKLGLWRSLLLKMLAEGLSGSEIYGWMKQHHQAMGLGLPAETTLRDWLGDLRKTLDQPARDPVTDSLRNSTDSSLTTASPSVAPPTPPSSGSRKSSQQASGRNEVVEIGRKLSALVIGPDYPAQLIELKRREFELVRGVPMEAHQLRDLYQGITREMDEAGYDWSAPD